MDKNLNHAVAGPRILIVQTHADNSGTQEIARQLNDGLTHRGYDVWEFYVVRGTAFLHTAPNVITGALPQDHGAFGYIRMAIDVWRQIRRLKPDVIVSMQWGGNLLSALVAPFAGSPVVIANQFTTPVIPKAVRRIDALQGSLGAFTKIVVNSQTIERYYADYPQAYRRRLLRIDHGFRERQSILSKRQARAKLALPDDAIVLGSVGRLSPTKNFAAGIQLLAQNGDWHLALCGHGPDRARLMGLATNLACADRLHLIGERDPDQVGDFLAALDLFIFPSGAETFGLAAVEAAQAGVPVLANDLAVMREVLSVEGEPCAHFVDVNDTAAFSAASRALLSNKTVRENLARTGKRLTTRFPVENMLDAYDHLIRSELGAAR